MIELALFMSLAADPGLDRVVRALERPAPAARRVALAERSIDASRFFERVLGGLSLAPAERAKIEAAIEQRLRSEATRTLEAGVGACRRVDRAPSAKAPSAGAEPIVFRCVHEGEHELVVWAAGGKAFDLSLDGALLSRNYRAQVTKFLRTGGVDELVLRLGEPRVASR